jgi:hypothetical protein
MDEKPSITGFFKNMLGFRDAKAETFKNDHLVTPAVTPLGIPPSSQAPDSMAEPGKPAEVKRPPAPDGSGNPTPPTEAYQNRKKGRKPHHDSVGDLERIIACVQSRGEATPGDLAQELGMARSSLTYNLNRLLAYSPEHPTAKSKSSNPYLLRRLLGQRRIERTGAGPSLRYRIVEVSQAGSPMEPTQSKQGQEQEGSK